MPLIHPGSNADMFTKLGRILSHGYMQCGLLPLKIAFPALATMLLGVGICIPNSTFGLNGYEQELLKQGLDSKEFHMIFKQNWLQFVSRFEERELPTSKDIVLQLAKYQFQFKPLPAIVAINAGIPHFFNESFGTKTLADIYLLYMSMVATPAKIIEISQEPQSMNAGEQRIFTYLCQMVGDMKAQERAFF